MPLTKDFPGHLVSGYEVFRHRFEGEKGHFRSLAEFGQSPPVLVIACSDSRVVPESIFNAKPGELFVVRNVAGLVPPQGQEGLGHETAAAIEYAVLALKVAHIVILGHSKCGGIRAFANAEETQTSLSLSPQDFVSRWLTLLKPAAARVEHQIDDFDHHCESLSQAAIAQGLANLRSYPWLERLERLGKLNLHGAYFDIGSGRLAVLDLENGTLMPTLRDVS